MNLSSQYIRLSLAISLILAEVIILSLYVDARTVPVNGFLSYLLSHAGNFLRWMVVSAALFTLFLTQDFKNKLNTLLATDAAPPVTLAISLHLACYLSFVYVTLMVFQGEAPKPQGLSYLWLGLLLLTSCSWCLIIARAKNWKLFLMQEKYALVGAIVSGLAIVALAFYFQRYWGSMTEFTLGSTKSLLSLFYDDLVLDLEHRKLGVGNFWVIVAPICSGIEGAVLSVSIAAIYLYLSRKELKLPHALILLPLACIASVLLNIVRIALLIILGAEISPAIAIGGFHSVAGWITAVLVALLIVFVFSSWKWIQKSQPLTDQTNAPAADAVLAQAILIPFVILTGASLVGEVFRIDFDYFYPVKTIAALSAIFYFWKQYNFRFPDRLIESIGIGILVGILWLNIVPTDTNFNDTTATALAAMPLWLSIAWGFFRLAGFWIVAPIIEELIFRGYLLSRLSNQQISNIRAPAYSLLALFGSSILFGILHNAWLAGTIAGLMFAFVRYRSQNISNSIVAHAVANILVALWAISTQNWSLV